MKIKIEKRITYSLILLLMFSPCLSAKTIIERKILFTPYILSKNKIMFNDTNRYTESYLCFGLNAAILIRYFMLEGFFETGKLIGISKNLDYYYNPQFPDSGDRSVYSTGFSIGFTFLTHYDNFFIISLGVDYTETNEIIYENTKYNIKFKKLLYSLNLSDRFLLFKDLILYTGIRFSYNFDKDGSPLYEGIKEFNNYFINLMIGFTIWF